MTGLLALHGGGEYAAGDEAAMGALLDAAAMARGETGPVQVVIVPTAAARQRPELAAAHGERAFARAGARAGVEVQALVAPVLDRRSADDPAIAALFEGAHLVHLPGGDPDLIPAVLRGTASLAGILRAHAAGACLAGASAGAMALAARLWTRDGPIDGLAVVPGMAVLPHFDPRRLASWQEAVDPDRELAWLGLDEQTLVIGRPGGGWRVAGRGRAHLAAGGGGPLRTARHGESISIG